MTNNKPRVLLFATNSYAGMGPFVASIVNCFQPSDNVRFFLVEREDKYYSLNIKKELLSKCRIEKIPTMTKLQTLYMLLGKHGFELKEQLLEYCEKEEIDFIHILTPFGDSKLTKLLLKNYQILYTVHDLLPHESKKAWYKQWRQNVLFERVAKATKLCKYLLTNSMNQLDLIKKIYPDKKSFYVPFPTLITPQIINGNSKVKELTGESNYLLFFGRIEAYKGIELLLDAFTHISSDYPGLKLVIAGKGEISIPEHKNILLIQRYIDDGELNDLYSNALAVVYPYISATQSGVLSVASYYGKPVVLSDVPFFKEIDFGKYYFKCGDSHDLVNKLVEFLSDFSKNKVQSTYSLYEENYSDIVLRGDLLKIYDSIYSN